MEKYNDFSDLSDKEDAEELDFSPFQIDWLDLSVVGCENKLGICGLPGGKFKKQWRSLPFDIKCLKESGVEDIFCLCTESELSYYRVPDLLKQYNAAGLTIHQHPFEDGMVPSTESLVEMLRAIHGCLTNNKKTLIHCYGGFGRSCLVAMCFLIYLNNDKNISIEEIREKATQLRGDKALGSVKQYNYCTDFKEILETYRNDKEKEKGKEEEVENGRASR